jgi:RimJ/RimL family protein N-acetyltransferase
MSILETERLIIKEWKLCDWQECQPLATDPRVLKYIPPYEPWSEERIRGFIKEAIELSKTRGWILWPMIHRQHGRLIGTCGFWHTFLPDIEIGWRMHPDYWGRGLMTEAASAVLPYGWERFDFPQVIAVAQTDNSQSIRIMHKLGMTFDKIFTHQGIEVVRYTVDNPL